MNRLQYLLSKLAEEASEVAQISLKTSQFGLEDVKPGQDSSNRMRMFDELNDLNGIIRMLNMEFGFGYAPELAAMEEKEAKVNRYYNYSYDSGLINDNRVEAEKGKTQ
jgi:hypothetical protein